MGQILIHQALNNFLAQVESIERTIDLRDDLIAFAQASPESLPIPGEELHQAVRQIGLSGLQPSLDGSVLLLAAAFEQFVSNVMIAYAADLPNMVHNYGDLPHAIRSANERLTGEALSTSRTRFADYDLRRFVDNLRNCQAGVVPYVLNGEALALNNRNLTSGTLRELISRLGIGNVWDMVGSTKTLKEWSGLGRTEAAQSRAQNQLNELIANRNQIAHRVGSATPGPAIVRSYLQFEQALARSLVIGLTIYANTLQTPQGLPLEP